MRKIIEAISILGGQEADEYLSFVAATHDDDEIRAEAAAARARLQRREAEAGSRRALTRRQGASGRPAAVPEADRHVSRFARCDLPTLMLSLYFSCDCSNIDVWRLPI